MSGRGPRWFSGIKYPYADNFPDNTWAQIIDACQKRQIPVSWKVKNQKAMTIGGTDYLIDIIGKDHDDYADGTGKAPLTFQLHDCYATKYRMASSRSNATGWSACEMRSTSLPAIFALMPEEVQAATRTVNKLTSAGNKSTEIVTTADKLFLPSEIEVFGFIDSSAPGEGAMYDYYAEGGSKMKYLGTKTSVWLLRGPRVSSAISYCSVSTGGNPTENTGTSSSGVAFAFCF